MPAEEADTAFTRLMCINVTATVGGAATTDSNTRTLRPTIPTNAMCEVMHGTTVAGLLEALYIREYVQRLEGGWSRCSDALVHHRKGNAPLTAGESLLNFKRTVNRMNSDYDRSVLSESCAYSVSETGDARSQYDEDNYAAHWHGDGAGGTTSSPSRDDSIDCKEAVRRGGPLPRDVGFRRRGRPFVARGVSSLTSLISVLWDIENCAVPNGVPAYQIVLKVRQTFYAGYREGGLRRRLRHRAHESHRGRRVERGAGDGHSRAGRPEERS
ncbi:hypothetical protein MRX96_042064 [Rhipicephalus microplus]